MVFSLGFLGERFGEVGRSEGCWFDGSACFTVSIRRDRYCSKGGVEASNQCEVLKKNSRPLRGAFSIRTGSMGRFLLIADATSRLTCGEASA